jgi:hypothetical protein
VLWPGIESDQRSLQALAGRLGSAYLYSLPRYRHYGLNYTGAYATAQISSLISGPDKGRRDGSPTRSPSRSRSRSRSRSPPRILPVARLQGAFDAFCNKKQGLKAGEYISNIAMRHGCRVRNCTLTGCRPNSRRLMLAPRRALIDFFRDTQVGGGVAKL